MASSIAFAAINPTAWFEVTARDLADIGNQQLRWPALVQIVAEPRGVPRKPYVFAGVCWDSTQTDQWRASALRKSESGVSRRFERRALVSSRPRRGHWKVGLLRSEEHTSELQSL